MSKERAEKDEGSAVGLDKGIQKLQSRRDSKEDRRVAGELKGQRVRGWTEKFLTRTLSGVIYVVVIVGCLLWGTLPTALLLSAMAWLCCSEFFRIARMAGRRPSEILGLACALAFPLAAWWRGTEMILCVLCFLLIGAGVWYVLNPRANVGDVAITLFGPVYCSLTLSCLTPIRVSDPTLAGSFIVLVIIGAIWAEDSCAYLVGSTIGRHKMAPRISPNKSWEGFYGGLVGAVGVWCVGAALHIGGLTFPIAIACGLLEGVAAVMGDLFESRLKRGVGVKDSGNLLPGHGGLLDRTDSLLFGSVVAYVFFVLGGML